MKQNAIHRMLSAGILAVASGFGSSASATCEGCHGRDGISFNPSFPSIAGMPEGDFLETMAAFKKGKRLSTVMGPIARDYTDDEIRTMARRFSGKRSSTIEPPDYR